MEQKNRDNMQAICQNIRINLICPIWMRMRRIMMLSWGLRWALRKLVMLITMMYMVKLFLLSSNRIFIMFLFFFLLTFLFLVISVHFFICVSYFFPFLLFVCTDNF